MQRGTARGEEAEAEKKEGGLCAERRSAQEGLREERDGLRGREMGREREEQPAAEDEAAHRGHSTRQVRVGVTGNVCVCSVD